MPSQQEVRWSQLRVGLLVVVSLVLLVILIFLMTSASGISSMGTHLTAVTYVPDANGLKVGAPVDLAGVPVGEVKAIRIMTDPARRLAPVQITMKLNPKFSGSLHADTSASLATTGLLGDAIVELDSSTAHGPALPNGGELKRVDLPSINTFLKSSQGTVDQLNVTLAKLDTVVDGLAQGKGTAGQLLANPALYNEANSTLAQLHTLSVNLNRGRGTAGKLLTDDAVYNRLNDAATRLDTLVTNLSSGQGTAGKLLTDDRLYNNLNEALTRTNGLLAQVDQGKGTMGLLFHDQAMANKLNDTVTQLDTLLAGVNSGKGTLGQLATNDSAYRNLDVLLQNASQLATMLREDPKKYLTIHMKIF